MSDSIPTPPAGFRQHPTWPELAANENGQIIRWPRRCLRPEWRRVRPTKTKSGYTVVGRPCHKGQSKWHTIVLECAHGRTYQWSVQSGSGLTANHRNGVKDDNRLSNLEIVTQCQNTRLSKCRHGLPRFIHRSRSGFAIHATVRGRMTHGGSFRSVQDATSALPAYLARIGHDAAAEYASKETA